MTWREKFDLFVGVYVAALGGEKPLSMRQDALQRGLTIFVLDAEIDAPNAALGFVMWKFGMGSKPDWVRS